MLLRFSVSNYRSFLEEQAFTMAAARGLKTLREENTFASGTTEKGSPDLLRSAAIYGPNASGKSNFVSALTFVQEMVVDSGQTQPDEAVPVAPLRLDPVAAEQDSRFEIDFIEQGVRYQFGFSANKARITSEWLIAYPKARPQLFYEREFDPSAGKDEYVFGNQFEGGRLRKDWAQQTGPNTLYFSRVVSRSSEEFQQLRKPYGWFSKRLRILGPRQHGIGRGFTVKQCEGEGKRPILEFLNAADVPIADIRVEKTPFDPNKLPQGMPAAFKEELSRQLTGKEVAEVRFFHRSADGKELIEFSEEDESDGTRSLFAFAGPWNDVLQNEYVLVVDELDSSLHPMIVRRLIELLSMDGSRAQLIFTTHDTTVMSSGLLRRDQFWFVERDIRGATRMFSLHDIKGREGEAIEERYFRGRYGALPVLKNLWRGHGQRA